MTAHVRPFPGVKPALAALRDRDLDPSIPAHHAELVRRGLAGDPALLKEAKKSAKRGDDPTRWGDIWTR